MSQEKRFRVSVLMGLLGAMLPFLSVHAATYTPQEQANMKVVADFYAALDAGDAAGDLKSKIRKIAEQYLKEDYIQHKEAGQAKGQGREGLIRLFEQMPAMPAPSGGTSAGPPSPPKVLALMAQGDLVVRISSRAMPAPDGKGGSPTFIFNMFRVQDGKLAEHWDGSSAAGMAMPGAPAGGPPGEPPAVPPKSR